MVRVTSEKRVNDLVVFEDDWSVRCKYGGFWSALAQEGKELRI